jgi:hypothetical protein
LPYVTGRITGRLRHRLAEDLGGDLLSEAIHVLGDAFEPVVVRADRPGEVIANFVAAAVLFDIGPVALALVLSPGGVTPLLIQPHAFPSSL